MVNSNLKPSGIAETHIEFKQTSESCKEFRCRDLFEFVSIENWDELVSFTGKWGCLFYEIAPFRTYMEMLDAEDCQKPPFKGRLGKALANWDVARALPLEEERLQYSILCSDIPKLNHWHDCVELTSVWWDAIQLFRQLLFLYGVAECGLEPEVLFDSFGIQEVAGRRYATFTPSDTSGFMRKLGVLPSWWSAEFSVGEIDARLFADGTVWIEEIGGRTREKADIVLRYSRHLLLEIVNERYRSFPPTPQLTEELTLEQVYLEGEDRALISALFAAFVDVVRGRRKVGVCPECGHPVDKSQSRGTERMYCDKPTCKVKASQRRKRFVRECKSTGGSIEYAVVRLGEPYRKSVERWWGED